MKTARITINVLLVSLLSCATASLAAEAGTARKAGDLKSEPFRDATTVGALERGDKVEILRKNGGWYRVRSAKGLGWVRMLSIRRGEARKDLVTGKELAALASGRAGTGQVVATTGIRGLSEAELKAAKFNAAELRKLETLTVTAAEARIFAARGGLQARKVN